MASGHRLKIPGCFICYEPLDSGGLEFRPPSHLDHGNLYVDPKEGILVTGYCEHVFHRSCLIGHSFNKMIRTFFENKAIRSIKKGEVDKKFKLLCSVCVPTEGKKVLSINAEYPTLKVHQIECDYLLELMKNKPEEVAFELLGEIDSEKTLTDMCYVKDLLEKARVLVRSSALEAISLQTAHVKKVEKMTDEHSRKESHYQKQILELGREMRQMKIEVNTYSNIKQMLERGDVSASFKDAAQSTAAFALKCERMWERGDNQAKEIRILSTSLKELTAKQEVIVKESSILALQLEAAKADEKAFLEEKERLRETVKLKTEALHNVNEEIMLLKSSKDKQLTKMLERNKEIANLQLGMMSKEEEIAELKAEINKLREAKDEESDENIEKRWSLKRKIESLELENSKQAKLLEDAQESIKSGIREKLNSIIARMPEFN